MATNPGNRVDIRPFRTEIVKMPIDNDVLKIPCRQKVRIDLADTHGFTVTQEQIDDTWGTHTCAEHSYEGIPKCPWPGCLNGTDRDIYRSLKLRTPKQGVVREPDDVEIEAERIFLRQCGPGRKSWIWREVKYAD